MIASHFNPRRVSAISRVSDAVFFSAEARSRSESLFQRIRDSGDPRSSIVPVLNQWIEEGRLVNQSELHGIVKFLRMFRRYSHALQVQTWMTGKMNFKHDSESNAIRLDLISKSRGLKRAEYFFKSIPSASKDDGIYNSMLSCYAAERLVREAEKLFEKMKELGFAEKTVPYNVMLGLYVRIGNCKRVDALVEEMTGKGIAGDSYTSNIVLNAYANTSNVVKMEKLFMEMEEDAKVTVDLCNYATVVKGYMRAGFFEKASSVLTKAEEVIKISGTRRHYELLISLYASLRKIDDVYRVWDMYKSTGEVFNAGYISMLSSLRRFDDAVGAQKIGEEWESMNMGFDPQVANLVILAYCKSGNLEKAFALSEKIMIEGKKLDGIAWQCLAMHCCRKRKLSKAVELLTNALSARNRPDWRLNKRVFASCLDYLKSKGDKAKAIELLGLVRDLDCFRSEIYNRLVDFVFGDKDSGAFALMKY